MSRPIVSKSSPTSSAEYALLKSQEPLPPYVRGLGWIEGRTGAIEYRWAEGRNERFSEIATEFASTATPASTLAALTACRKAWRRRLRR